MSNNSIQQGLDDSLNSNFDFESRNNINNANDGNNNNKASSSISEREEHPEILQHKEKNKKIVLSLLQLHE
jgi:hypothetical protein